MKRLELLLSDPDYYETATDPMGDILDPWAQWVNEIAAALTSEATTFGLWGGACGAIWTFWDIRWTGEHCETLVANDQGDELWWTPPVPAPAALMRYAKLVDEP